jgi:hypothetical protein
MREGNDLGVVRGIVIPEHTLLLANIGVRIVHPHRVSKLGAYYFIEVKVRVIPEKDTAANESIVIV